MHLTKEMLAARATELQKQAESLKAQLNAVVGALRECDYWQALLDKAETPKE